MSDAREQRDALVEELDRTRQRLGELERELRALDRQSSGAGPPEMVVVPEALRATFRRAQNYVAEYFTDRWEDPASARIVVSGERYILIRAASMSIEFFDLVQSLYRDRGDTEAMEVARGFLFDVAHALGKADAAAFHERMGVVDPVEKLSAGPVHFAYAGWANVDIHPDSAPSPDERYYLAYDHPHSFEAESWIKRGRRADFPVCIMNAGYSSGWCEQSFDLPLVATELTCRARGDAHCRFIMAHPAHIHEHLDRAHAEGYAPETADRGRLEVPEFFKRKRLEDELRHAHDDLEVRVASRTSELEQRATELRTANERLAELYDAREEFLAMISHELRTPLVTGLGYIELLLRGKLGPISDGVDAGMKVALRNLKRLAGLVDDILRYHQISHREKASAMLATIDLAQVCTECVDDLLVRTGRPVDSVRVETMGELPPALADEDMIRQVVSNLLNNATRHGGEGARIVVALEQLPDARARVTVRDDGAGMPPDVLRRATEPFVRSGDSEGGLGLGLAIVRSLLRANDAELHLESALGRGTLAAFTLPLLAAGTAPAAGLATARDADDGPSPPAFTAAGTRVLVVDDDSDTRAFMELTLGAQGFEVCTAETAEDGLERLTDFRADLMLVDLCLPGMDGLEFCRRIKARPESRETPVYLFTARAEDAIQRDAIRAGCDGTLVKPVAVDDLLARLAEALDPEETSP